MDYLKEKKDSFRRKQLRVFLNNLCVDNESILCQIWDNIHILLGAEKQALTKHPSGEDSGSLESNIWYQASILIMILKMWMYCIFFSFNGHNIQFEVSPPLFLFQVYLFVMQRGFLLCFMSNMAANKTIYSLEPSR